MAMRKSMSPKAICLLGAAISGILLASPAGAAECAAPGQAPIIPDGALATVDQMKTAHTAVQSYVNTLQAYQDCLEAQIKMAPKTAKPEELQKMRDQGNAAIDQATSLSNNYSEQVRAYKTRAVTPKS
jgi:hypothetical protein